MTLIRFMGGRGGRGGGGGGEIYNDWFNYYMLIYLLLGIPCSTKLLSESQDLFHKRRFQEVNPS